MPLRIQIIEDESDFSEPLAEMLRAEGYTVRIFASLAEAQDTAWLATTDLVILDRAFPDGDGLSLLPGIRQGSNLPVIILTGAGAIEERIRGLDAVADYYLVKPVDVDELFAVIRRYDRKQSGIADVVDQKAIWHLDAATWSLTAPSGLVIALTHREALLMANFAVCPGLAVHRDSLASSMGFAPNAYDFRRMESMLSRLRKKIQAAGIDDFPLKTVYGGRYAFHAILKVQGVFMAFEPVL